MIFHIVIPVFNRLQLTVRCLESLLAQTDQGMRIILVDDGSTDGTSAVVHTRFPSVHVIPGDGKLWWSGATNRGIQHALSCAGPDDYILLVNNDTYFDQDFVAHCRVAAEKHPTSLIGSVIVDPCNGRILQGGIRINWYSAKFVLLNRGKSIRDFQTGYIEAVSVVTGRGVLVPCNVYRKVGLYDDRHLQQHGDTELPRRAVLNGYRLIVDYNLVTYNSDPSETTGDTFYRPIDFFDYMFGHRSKRRLKTRFWFAIKTATNPLQGFCFLVCDFCRGLVHFLLRVRISRDQYH